MSFSSASNPALTSTEQGAVPVTTYKLQSDLAQYCLPQATADPLRKYAWANSLCAVTIAVAFSGMLYFPKVDEFKVEDPNEIIPVVFTPPVEPPREVEQAQEEAPADPETVVEPVNVATVVAIDPSAAAFAVPVTGPVTFAPAARAQAPPTTVRRAAAPPKPVVFTGIGKEGYPRPPYPPAALRRGLEGTVTLYVIVDENGIPSDVKVQDGSGFTDLDSYSVKWVKSQWNWPSGAVRHFLVPFQYQLSK